MNTYYRLLLFYFIDLLILLEIKVIFGSSLLELLSSPFLWILPTFFVLLGQGIGFATNILLEKPNKKSTIYLISGGSTSLLLSFGLAYLNYSSWKHEKYFGNIEHNKIYVADWPPDKESEKRIAFETLISKFNNPNDIRLNGYSVSRKDSMKNGYPQTFYTVRLMYNKINDTNLYKSDITVFVAEPHLLYFDKLLDKSDEQEIDSTRQKIKNILKEINDNSPDSIKKVVNEAFKNAP